MADAQSQGIVSRAATALASPFGTSMTWLQLAAVVVFVTIVLFAWKQVVDLIIEEV